MNRTIKVGLERATLKGHTNDVYSVCFSPDGKTLASAPVWDKTVKLWDAATGQERATLKGHTNWVHSVASARTARRWPAQRGQDGEAVGRRDRDRNAPPSRDTRAMSFPWRSARTARLSPAPVRTGRSTHGTLRRWLWAGLTAALLGGDGRCGTWSMEESRQGGAAYGKAQPNTVPVTSDKVKGTPLRFTETAANTAAASKARPPFWRCWRPLTDPCEVDVSRRVGPTRAGLSLSPLKLRTWRSALRLRIMSLG